MNMYYDPKEKDRVAEARESFSGRLLTDPQFDEAMAIAGILESEIKKSGTFKEKLADYANAFARTEKFDVMKAETTLRDLFKARTGQSMNQLRETLVAKEDNLPEQVDDRAKQVTREIRDMIKDGNKMPFHRAYDHHAGVLANEFGITNAGAKRVMTEAFRENADGEKDWKRNTTAPRSKLKKPNANKAKINLFEAANVLHQALLVELVRANRLKGRLDAREI
jgi:hypothetical protein